MAAYSGGPLNGMPAIVEARIDEGHVLIIGTQPSEECLIQLLENYRVRSSEDRSSGVVVAHRLTHAGEYAGFVAVNTSAVAGYFSPTAGQHTSLRPFEVIVSKFC